MKPSTRNAAFAALIGMGAVASTSGIAQQTSEMIGPISKIVADGYAFAGGSALGAEQQRSITGPNKITYEVKYRVGFAYFAKGANFLVCEFELVTANPIPDHLRLGKPDSKCFRIK